MSEPRKPGDSCQKAESLANHRRKTSLRCRPYSTIYMYMYVCIYNIQYLPTSYPYSTFTLVLSVPMCISSNIIPTGILVVVCVYNNIIRPAGCLRDVHGSQLIPPPLPDTVFPNAKPPVLRCRVSKQTIDPIDFHNKLATDQHASFRARLLAKFVGSISCIYIYIHVYVYVCVLYLDVCVCIIINFRTYYVYNELVNS